ncbi:MAG: hypothetical protein RQ856_04835 [Candidatus Izemoplasmatales bacterium]|nr:hypothetical protein [Candidatus Izemoplasmatales bacterium]
MQTFTKRITTLTMIITLGFALLACGGNTTTEIAPGELQIPRLTNPDAIFYSTEDYDITYRDLYNSVKVNDGLNQLLAMVDTDLLSDYFDDITQEQIDEKRLKLTYDTSDPEKIADLDEKTRAKYETNFEESLYLMGYTEGNYDDYIRLVLVRENYAIELMTSDDSSEETWHVGLEEIANYYDATYMSDIKSIKIKFNSQNDANAIMRSLNLISKNGQIMLYTGTKPIEEVPSFELNETNTQVLTEEEILEYYILMYNMVYADYREPLNVESTALELMQLDELTLNYDDVNIFNNNLARFIFFTLGNYEDYQSEENLTSYYTYKPEKFYSGRDTAYYMILNLTGYEKEMVAGFEGTKTELIEIIGADLYNEIEQEMIDNNLSAQTFVARRIADLRREHDFVIYDYYMAVDYKANDTNYVENEEGSLTLIASYDDKEITPDQLLTYAMNQNAAMYLVYSAQLKAVRSAHYEDVYCLDTATCEYDYTQNESAKMIEHIAAYNSMEAQFLESMYSTYYTFEDYLYLAYGAKNMEEMINNYYVKSTLQPLYIFDQIIENDYAVLNSLLDLMGPYYDNYFSLDVTHLLIYIDKDEDGSPDKYSEFYEELVDTTEYDAKLAALEAAIRTYMADDTKSLSDLVNAYKLASRTDATWGEFKSYGFFLLTENLSTQGSLTYANSINKFEDSFVEALISLYQTYNLEENLDEDYLFGNTLIESSYGLHFIKVEKGTAFEKPTAEFTMTYDDEEQPEFDMGFVSDQERINFEQLKLYSQYRFSVISFGSIDLEELYGFTRPEIPSTVNTALKDFATTLHDALYVVGYLNVGIITDLNSGEFANNYAAYYEGTEAELLAVLAELSNIYNRQIFAELDLR